jgi:glycosyltransferase involved in cell wall biosynthesis
MRILFLSHYALPHTGGIEIVVDQLARELVQRGCEVTHLASGCLRGGENELEEPPYRVVRIPAINPLERRLGVPYPLFDPIRLSRAIAREASGVDVVHAHGMLYASSLVGLSQTRRTAVRVLTEHAGRIGYRNPLLDVTERIAIRTVGRRTATLADAIVVVGARIEGEMRALAPAARVERIENGVELSLFHPAGEGERTRLRHGLGWDDTPRVLFLGRMVEKKGAHLVLRAARASDRHRFVFVTPDGGSVDAGEVHDARSLSRARLADFYRAADVFVVPSRGEGGFPLTAREAMACGLPVIVGQDEAYGEIARQAAAGLRMVPPDPMAILGAVDELLAAGSAARTAVAEIAARQFLWSAAAERHLELYQSLHQRRAGGERQE